MSPFGRFLAGTVVGLRFLIVPAWIAAAIAATLFLPTLPSSQNGSLTQLVATNTPSYRAEQHALRLFRYPIVATTESVQRDPNRFSAKDQLQIVRRAVQASQRHAHAIAFALPVINTLGVFPSSRERSTTAVTYLFFQHTSSLEHEQVLGHAYAAGSKGFVGLTGPGPARLQQYTSITDALPWVSLATVLAIGLLVGLNFRAPGPPLIVLAVGGIAYLVDVRVLGWISAHSGISIPSEIEPLLVVLLLGITTDYAIFYLSRQRRELAEGRSPVEAARTSASIVTPIVFTAGLIVAGGTAALLVGQVEFLRAFGPGLALTALVCVVVAVTLVPGLLALLGRSLYWPSADRIGRAEEGMEPPKRSLRRRVAYWSTARPLALVIAVVCLAALGAAASGLARTQLGFGLIDGLPSSEAQRAADAVSTGFAPGILAPAQLVVERPGITTQQPALSRLETLLGKQPGVAGILGPREQPFAKRSGAAFSASGSAARMALIFDTDPFGGTAIHHLRTIQDRLPALLRQSGLGGANAEISGGTATAADTIAQVLDDLTRIALVTLAVAFLLLAIFLRALVAPLYLLAASVVALMATLGLTTYVFQDLLGYGDLTYFVPFGAAVLLVSLGSDYNLFVTGRIWEEAGRRPLREAVSVAAPTAARTITLAGMVLAVSFALLAVVPLRAFAELAFALAVGVLIDAFVVRTFLVPALISLFGEAGAWPGGRLRRAEPALES